MMLNLLRLLLTALSFAGWCALLRRRAGLSGASAPLAACCAVTALMMLGGMAGVLPFMWWALFAGGLGAAAWCWGARRQRVDWLPAAFLGAFFLYAWLRFRNAYVTGPDSVSHWALAVKYLLRENRFPDDSTRLIYFQTYPLGTASFIYYLVRPFGGGEGRYIIAQQLLHAAAFLPVLGLVKKRRAFGLLLAAGLLAYMLPGVVDMTSLQVDGTLAFLTVGGLAALAEAWDRPRRAAWVILPTAAALVFVKNSGAFFALALIVPLAVSAKAHGAGRRPGLRAFLAGAGAALAGFGLWTLHVRLAYAGAQSSKHAMSLSHFAQVGAGKSASLVRGVAKGMLARLVRPDEPALWLLVLALLMLIACALEIRGLREGRAEWSRALRRTVVGCAAAFAAWEGLLFLMYVFSMTPEEARTLASISRYESTIYAALAGGVAVFALRLFCREDAPEVPAGRFTRPALIGALALFLVFGGDGLRDSSLWRLVEPPAREPEDFAPLFAIADENDIPEGSSFLLFTRHDEFQLQSAVYGVKYMYYTNDIAAICGGIDRSDYEYDAYYLFRDIYAHAADVERADDLRAALERAAGGRDYLLVCCRDEAFEAALADFLAEYDGNMKVLYGAGR